MKPASSKHFPSKIQETGLILFVKNYEKCVRFYSEKIGLRVRFQKAGLVNFDLGNGYLLIEKGKRKSGFQNGALRINVAHVLKTAQALQKRGVKVNFYSASWGDIGELKDPDGNPIQLCKWK